MATITVEAFNFDEENEDKLAGHGLRERDVRAILEGVHRVIPNKKGHRASHQVIGRDSQGRCIVVCIEPTHDPVLWRPVTAWVANTNHQLALCP